MQFIDLRTSNITGGVNEKGYVEKTSEEKSEVGTLKSKKSKDDLQPYIGSNYTGGIVKSGKWAFLYSLTDLNYIY